MAKNKAKLNNIVLYGKKGNSKKLFWIIISGVILLLIGIFLTSYGKKLTITIPKDEKKYIEFIKENSNYFEIVKEWRFDDYWPKQYFEISYSEKKITFWNDNIKTEIYYEDHSVDKNIKYFADDNSKSSFEKIISKDKILSDNKIEDLLEKEFKEAIDKNDTLEENVRNISIIYNLLAGHPRSYILLGRKSADKTWKYYTEEDFPKYKVSFTPNEKKQIVSYYDDKTDSNSSNNSKFEESVKKSIKEISVKAISFNYRKDSIYYGNESMQVSEKTIPNLKAPYKVETLNKNGCGWVVADSDKEKLIKAKDYYKPSKNYIFVKDDINNNIKDLAWNEKSSMAPIMKYSGISSLIIAIILLIGVIIKFYIHVKSNKNRSKSENYDYAKFSDKNDYEEIVDENFYKNDVVDSSEDNINREDYKNRGFEEFIRSSEYKKRIEEEKKKAIEAYKNSKEYKRIIEKERENAVESFKKEDGFKKLLINSKNWRNFIAIDSEKDVIKWLNKISEKKSSFPIVRTLATIYDDIKNKEKNAERQIGMLLAEVDKQLGVKTNLHETFTTLCDNSKYAIKVRNTYEHSKSVIGKYANSPCFNEIVSQKKDLSIWERMAVMILSMKCTNELFSIFNENNLDENLVDKAIEIHKDDILQIFATRIFTNYVEDKSKSEGMFADFREKITNTKITDVMNGYQILMAKSAAYTDFIKKLDSIYDKIKNLEAFISVMENQFVTEFIDNERKKSKGEYFSLLIAMGLHMSDYVRYMSGDNIDYCPNMKFVLSGLKKEKLEPHTEFRYKDPEYSGEYTNRVYEWLNELGVEHLKALVGSQLIKP